MLAKNSEHLAKKSLAKQNVKKSLCLSEKQWKTCMNKKKCLTNNLLSEKIAFCPKKKVIILKK